MNDACQCIAVVVRSSYRTFVGVVLREVVDDLLWMLIEFDGEYAANFPHHILTST